MKPEGGALKIALKYCGGCRTQYDRADLVRQMGERLVGKAVFVAPGSAKTSAAVFVHGCPTACADLSVLNGMAVWRIGSPAEAGPFIAFIEQLTERNAMTLSREEMRKALQEWNRAWDRFDLEGVLGLMHEDVLFENWTGGQAVGKTALRKAWQPWFAQGGFRFIGEDTFIDEKEQKVLFRWLLEWPCPQPEFQGKIEKRRGVDVMHFKEGKIILKLTYSKTTLEIDGQRRALHV